MLSYRQDGEKGKIMEKMIKDGHRKWTKASAKAWVERVNIGIEKPGLKYCSALDYLRNHCQEV